MMALGTIPDLIFGLAAFLCGAIAMVSNDRMAVVFCAGLSMGFGAAHADGALRKLFKRRK